MIAQRARRIAVESIVAGMGLSSLAMLAATIGWLAPVPAAVVQEVIDVVVILNASQSSTTSSGPRPNSRATWGQRARLPVHASITPATISISTTMTDAHNRHMSLDPPDATSDQAGLPILDEDYLILSTIHSAKGQEWRSVFVLNVVDGCIPISARERQRKSRKSAGCST